MGFLLLLPLKAILLNLLSLGAACGVLVAVFQWGLGKDLFGFGDFGFIQNFVPVLLFGLLLSLSTDYEVFLLSRVKEEYVSGKSNEESVALGLASHPDHALSREAIFEHVWGLDAEGDLSTVTVRIGKLREKLEPDPANPQYIETVWGAGYRFRA